MRWSPSPDAKVYLAVGATDMRKSINGLALWVSDILEINPMCPHWFVFCGKQKNKIKILQWEHNGFWLHYCRLEKDKFHWPKNNADIEAIAITSRELHWLLDGLQWEKTRGHRAVNYKYVG
jgi:transposase